MLKSPGAPRVLWPSAARAFGLVALVCLGLAGPSPAAAWTDASVRSVKANIVVAPDGTAHVALRVAVRVHGGWLEGLELAGLDPGLTLDPSAPTTVTGEDGAVYAPSVTTRAEGEESTRVQLSFERSGAPRRGAYEVALTYTTSLAHRATEALSDGETVRVSWTLPPWETGLDGVELTLDVPGGARAAQPLDAEADTRAAELTVVSVGGRTQLTWRRPHLPRTTVWTIAAEVPAASLAPALRRVRAEPPSAPRSASSAPAWPVAVAVALALLLLGTLTARGRSAALARAGLTTAPLAPMPRPLRGALCFALVAAAPLVAVVHPAFAVAPLALLLALLLVRRGTALEVGDGEVGEGALVEERPARPEELRGAARAEWLARTLTLDALLDATTPLGALVALSLVAASRSAYLLLASNAAAPLVVLGAALGVVPLVALTHRSRRRPPAAALLELRRTAARLRLAADAPAALALLVSTRAGKLVASRLRVVPETAPDGLRALEVVVAERTAGTTTTTEAALRATTRSGSDAERALALTLDDATPTRDATHTTRLAPLSALDDALRALAAAACASTALLDADEMADDDAALSALLFDERAYLDEPASSARSARSAD